MQGRKGAKPVVQQWSGVGGLEPMDWLDYPFHMQALLLRKLSSSEPSSHQRTLSSSRCIHAINPVMDDYQCFLTRLRSLSYRANASLSTMRHQTRIQQASETINSDGEFDFKRFSWSSCTIRAWVDLRVESWMKKGYVPNCELHIYTASRVSDILKFPPEYSCYLQVL